MRTASVHGADRKGGGMMNTYRITYVNPAFSPRASYAIVEANSTEDAVRRFLEQINQACVIQTIGDRVVVRIEQLPKGGV